LESNSDTATATMMPQTIFWPYDAMHEPFIKLRMWDET